MIAPHSSLHSLFAASALLASLQPLTGCAGPDQPPDEALRGAFPGQAAAVLSVGPGFIRSDGGLERAAAGRRGSAVARLPGDGSDAIVFALDGGATLRVREVGAEGEAMLADRAVAYRRAGGASFWTATPGGVEEWLLLEAAAVQRGAPVAAWEVEGGALAERDGAIEIADATGAVRLRVTAPAAYAAGGREVGAQLAARGGRIELFVDAEGEQVLVDPAWQSPPPPTMATRRSHHAAALLGTRVLVTGGTNLYGVAIDSTELYDPAESAWSNAPAPGRMGRARTDHAAIALDSDRVLVIGGDRGGADSTYEVYDARTMSWEVEGTIPLDNPTEAASPAPLHRHTATRLGEESGDVLIVGGTADLDNVAVYDNVFRYDPSTGALEEAARLLEPRTLHTATLLETGKVLVVGGYRSGAGLRTTELYDPASDTWTAGPSMMEGSERYMHTATLLPDGRVLVVGYSPLTEIYDPSTNSFSPGEPLETHGKRHAHSATLLPNGCVLVAGGRLNSSSDTADVELYNPDRNRWITIAPLSEPRAFHEATYIDQDGSVLITGGRVAREASYAVERFTLGRPGEPCGDQCECQSGFCVDGVCCDSACDGGACDACSVEAGASADGACSPLTGNACDDGNACTSGDACDAGTCAGTNDDTATCGDDEPCTRHACVAGSCVAEDDDGATCDDGDPCTTEDACGEGACAGKAITCPATDACHEEGTCDPETSRCVWPSKADNVPCEDGGVCLAGACIHGAEASSSSQGGAGAGEPTGPAEHAGGGGSGGGAGPATDDDGGCGCRAAGAAAPGGNAAAALLMAAAAWRASRRRRRPCPSAPRPATPR
ncbi:kelch repeat-containing protein [Sorangium sp. So ce176]|uniref:Kelch repeat-containing protein n=1 Tax=Sorangium sp. So ce176 TaxID=3133286 RepID=UPI003F614C23